MTVRTIGRFFRDVARVLQNAGAALASQPLETETARFPLCSFVMESTRVSKLDEGTRIGAAFRVRIPVSTDRSVARRARCLYAHQSKGRARRLRHWRYRDHAHYRFTTIGTRSRACHGLLKSRFPRARRVDWHGRPTMRLPDRQQTVAAPITFPISAMPRSPGQRRRQCQFVGYAVAAEFSVNARCSSC